MYVLTSRGRGSLVPLFFIVPIFLFLPPREWLALEIRQWVAALWLVCMGLWLAVRGVAGLRAAAEERGAPLALYEWLIDPPWKLNAPFHSFMYVQMPWWSIGYWLAAYYLVAKLILAPAAP